MRSLNVVALINTLIVIAGLAGLVAVDITSGSAPFIPTIIWGFILALLYFVIYTLGLGRFLEKMSTVRGYLATRLLWMVALLVLFVPGFFFHWGCPCAATGKRFMTSHGTAYSYETPAFKPVPFVPFQDTAVWYPYEQSCFAGNVFSYTAPLQELNEGKDTYTARYCVQVYFRPETVDAIHNRYGSPEKAIQEGVVGWLDNTFRDTDKNRTFLSDLSLSGKAEISLSDFRLVLTSARN